MRLLAFATTILLGTGCNALFGGDVTGPGGEGDADDSSTSTDGGDDDDGGDMTDGAASGSDAHDGGTGDASTCAGWTARVEVATGQPQNAALAKSPDGTLHVVYDLLAPAAVERTLEYRTRPPGAAWSAAQYFPSAKNGDVAVDSSGRIHVVYNQDRGRFQLAYTTRMPSGSWSTPWVSEAYAPGRFPRLALLSSGPAVLSDEAGLILWSEPAATGWDPNRTGCTTCMRSGPMTLVVGPGGDVYVVAAGYESPIEEYGAIWLDVRTAAGAWSFTDVDPVRNVFGSHTAVAVDATGTVHVVFTSGTAAEGILAYTRRSAGGMFTYPVQIDTTRVVSHLAATLDASGNLHVVYKDAVEADLVYRRRTAAGTWSAIEVVDTVGGVGSEPKIVAGATGDVHVVYNDDTGGRLLYARRCAP